MLKMTGPHRPINVFGLTGSRQLFVRELVVRRAMLFPHNEIGKSKSKPIFVGAPLYTSCPFP
jgi:hypothetical protein